MGEGQNLRDADQASHFTSSFRLAPNERKKQNDSWPNVTVPDIVKFWKCHIFEKWNKLFCFCQDIVTSISKTGMFYKLFKFRKGGDSWKKMPQNVLFCRDSLFFVCVFNVTKLEKKKLFYPSVKELEMFCPKSATKKSHHLYRGASSHIT